MKTKILVSVVAVFFIIVGNAFAVSFDYAGSPMEDVDTYGKSLLYLNVTDTGTISDLNVSLVVSGPFVDDLIIRLFHNDFTYNHRYLYIGQHDDPEGSEQSYINATFDDQASNQYPVMGTVEGVFKPLGPLSLYNGEDISGTWILVFNDLHNIGDGNDVLAWSISGTTEAVPEPSTMLLLGLGLLGLATVRRKIKK